MDSLLAQTFDDFEAIVVDDASTDDTGRIVAAMARRDQRIRLVTSADRQGPGSARNRGLEEARGAWVTFLDADDWYDPRRLESLRAATERHPHPLFADNQWFVESGCSRPWRRLVEDLPDGERWMPTEAFLAGNPIGFGFRPGLGLLKPFVHRAFLDRHAIRYDTDLRFQEDLLFLLRCLAQSRALVLLGSATYFYRQHPASRLRDLQPSDFERLVWVAERAGSLFTEPADAAIRTALSWRLGQVRRHAKRRAQLATGGAWAVLRHPALAADLLPGVLASGTAVVRRRAARVCARFARSREPPPLAVRRRAR